MIRANEAVTAEYTDIDEEKRLWVIPPQKMKQKHGGKPHIVPLSKQAYSLLQKIKTLANGNGYLFPSVRTKTGRMNPQTVNKAIRKSLGYSKEALTAHGLRKTTSSYLHEKGILPDVVELCLSHTIADYGAFITRLNIYHKGGKLCSYGEIMLLNVWQKAE